MLKKKIEKNYKKDKQNLLSQPDLTYQTCDPVHTIERELK
jgi:hypothetical protein